MDCGSGRAPSLPAQPTRRGDLGSDSGGSNRSVGAGLAGPIQAPAREFGSPTPPVQVWRDRLAVQKQGGMVRTERSGNLPAEAHMRVLAHQPGMPPLALIQLEPKTGRSHQLRVQCADRHLPIVGDATYGDFRANREFAKRTGERRMFLHSAETRFDYEWSGRRIAFGARAPLPDEFEQCLRAGRR